MLVNSPIFVWLFMTAWIWAGLIALALYHSVQKQCSYPGIARAAMVVFTVIAVQSAFWIVGSGVAYFFSLGETTLGEVFHWLLGSSQSAIVYWVASLLGLAVGVAAEIEDQRGRGDHSYNIGPWFAFFVTGGGMALYGLFLFLAFLVNSVIVFG